MGLVDSPRDSGNFGLGIDDSLSRILVGSGCGWVYLRVGLVMTQPHWRRDEQWNLLVNDIAVRLARHVSFRFVRRREVPWIEWSSLSPD